ncbi:unnamed protein product [Caenorhabditis auriculariae]|uniref:XRN2-binding (XTBD) domain-containing protein n=1 Tax=Caenorhabditis auriculariae TaxID=2777116 RepID=A0A8S1HU44_9PELO|nr:unnamed protein product [Caenorhabditis auriculariae]
MGKDEEIDAERKAWESEEAWQLRRAFLRAHFDDFPSNRLRCLSQLFVNIHVLGCEYSPSLMESIRELGAGISADVKKSSGAFVRASQAKKRVPVSNADLNSASNNNNHHPERTILHGKRVNEDFGNKNEPAMPMAPPAKVQVLDDDAKIKDFKVFLSQTGHHLSAVQMLNAAGGRLRIPWRTVRKGNEVAIEVDRFVAFQHKFSDGCTEIEDCALNAVIESFLSCEPSVSGKEILFGESGPSKCYLNSVNRSFSKIRSSIEKEKTFKGLTKVLEAVNITVAQRTKHLQGWSQQLDVCAGDVLLATRTLSKDECTRPKMLAIVDGIASRLCAAIGANGAAAVANTSDKFPYSLVLSTLL